uniref:Uncharacterized protein n=1 Tax=Panagrellus redivivus TaxID=6233 RepID=A0A7E4VHD3_PANRE
MLFNGTLILILSFVHTTSSNSSNVAQWLPKGIIWIAIGAALFVLMVIVALTASNKSKVFRRYVATCGINSKKCCHILKIDLNHRSAKFTNNHHILSRRYRIISNGQRRRCIWLHSSCGKYCHNVHRCFSFITIRHVCVCC